MWSYEKELANANAYALRQKQKQEIREAKHKNDQKKPLSFGKMALVFMLVNCTVIEIYAMVVMFLLADLSALPGLIAAIIGETISVISYFAKSTIENKESGITYELAMRSFDESESDQHEC